LAPRLERLRGKLLASAIEELASANHQSACSQLNQFWENHIKITVAADIQSMDLQPQSLSGRLDSTCRIFENNRISRIDEERDGPRIGNHLVQQFQSLWRHLGGHLSYACGVATWTVEAGHETELVWVVAHFKHDRNRRCRRFCRK